MYLKALMAVQSQCGVAIFAIVEEVQSEQHGEGLFGTLIFE